MRRWLQVATAQTLHLRPWYDEGKCLYQLSLPIFRTKPLKGVDGHSDKPALCQHTNEMNGDIHDELFMWSSNAVTRNVLFCRLARDTSWESKSLSCIYWGIYMNIPSKPLAAFGLQLESKCAITRMQFIFFLSRSAFHSITVAANEMQINDLGVYKHPPPPLQPPRPLRLQKLYSTRKQKFNGWIIWNALCIPHLSLVHCTNSTEKSGGRWGSVSTTIV